MPADNSISSQLILGWVTIFIAAATLVVTFYRNKWEKSKAQRELFEQFNKRFDAMNEDQNKIRSGSIEGHDIPVSFQPTERRPNGRTSDDVIQDYLNLCAEEYLWYTDKLVEKKVWLAWAAGMKYYLAAPVFDEYFERQKQYSPSYYNLFDELKWEKPKTFTQRQ